MGATGSLIIVQIPFNFLLDDIYIPQGIKCYHLKVLALEALEAETCVLHGLAAYQVCAYLRQT